MLTVEVRPRTEMGRARLCPTGLGPATLCGVTLFLWPMRGLDTRVSEAEIVFLLAIRGARHRVAGGRGWSSAQARNRRGCVSLAWDQLSSTLWCHPFLQLGRRLIRSLAPVHCTVTGSEADGVLLPYYRVSSSDLGWGR